ncbi:MAG: Gfo/Idh/MocA family oxidoreductase [Acidimicrobiia bacterium]
MLTVGVIGYGYWGPNLVRNFHSLPGSTVKYVCDLDVSRLALAEQENPGIQGIVDAEAVLADPEVDIVAVATPVTSHYRLTKAALEAGKHVFVEKPLAASSAEALEVTELAARKNLVLQVDHTYVYSAPVRKIRSAIAGGELGQILYVDSVRVNLGLFQETHSVIWDLAPHDLSIMMHILGRSVTSVSAVAIAHYDEFEQPHNMAYLTLYFEDGILGHVHVNWLAPVKVRRMMIGGTRRMLLWDDVEPDEKVRIYEKSIAIDLTPEERYHSLVQYRLGDMVAPRLENFEALRAECAEFLASIEDGRPVVSDGWFGTALVEVLEAADKSILRNGMRVEVEYRARAAARFP